MPIRILCIFDTLEIGGSETFILNVFKNIDREKILFDFVVHTPIKGALEDDLTALGGKIYRLPRLSFKTLFSYCPTFDRFLKEHPEYKIVYDHNYNMASFYMKIANNNNRISICHCHNKNTGFNGNWIFKQINRLFVKNIANHRFACSPAAGKYLFGDKDFTEIKNGIETRNFRFNPKTRESVRREFGFGEKSVVLGHIGKFRRQKNHSFLIDVFKDYNKINPDSYLILVGVGEYVEQTKAKAKKYGIEDKVLFLGKRYDVAELMQAMDLFLFPSLYEGLGIVIVEAQGAGLKSIIANTIPKEVILSSRLVKTLPIDQGTKPWVDNIINNIDYKREDTSDILIKAGYDISYTAEYLTDYFTKILKDTRK